MSVACCSSWLALICCAVPGSGDFVWALFAVFDCCTSNKHSISVLVYSWNLCWNFHCLQTREALERSTARFYVYQYKRELIFHAESHQHPSGCFIQLPVFPREDWRQLEELTCMNTDLRIRNCWWCLSLPLRELKGEGWAAVAGAFPTF